ncbi:MAG: hypothetical protein OXH76_18360 [Boseongicola sp.]|nr:hypothetical protein [Boseongicola sp.]
MNLFEQGEEVAREMERLRSFRRQVNRHSVMRQLAPGTAVKLLWSQLRLIWDGLRKLQLIDFSQMRRAELELICNKDEKASPYYRIVLCDPYGSLHALSEHLHATFPTFNWLALEDLTRIRVGQIPGINLVSFLNAVSVLMSLLAALGAYTIVEFLLRHLDMANDLIATGLAVLIWLLVVRLMILVVRHKARKRLQGTLGILGYMAIRAREGELPSARN